MIEEKQFIDSIILKEKRRNENMLLRYMQRISSLPRGSLIIRHLNGRDYCYLKYRDGKKIVQEYAGTIDKKEMLLSKIEEREHLKQLIKMLKKEKIRIIKMEMIK